MKRANALVAIAPLRHVHIATSFPGVPPWRFPLQGSRPASGCFTGRRTTRSSRHRPRTQLRVLQDGDKEFAFFHLSIGSAPRPSDVRFGVNFGAEVTFKTPIDNNELKHWRFGFIQVAKVVKLNFTYLGRTPKE